MSTTTTIVHSMILILHPGGDCIKSTSHLSQDQNDYPCPMDLNPSLNVVGFDLRTGRCSSTVEITEVITEQWIQAQQLEQLISDIQGKHLPKVQEAFDVHWDGKKASLFVQSYLT
ncbi:unnamed protein product [Brassica rapa]|uniref:Uncharacterized protein n=2 Tax=Brassica TaxID=3705 RepID=A0A8D9LSR6_BRACM|nr:unnamed protein product [Brassica napus]CAG7885372.1 unnamed protein product [Brassica rapa]